MTYASASNVMAYSRTLKLGAFTFDSTTIPTDTDVNTWLAAGYSRINSELEGRGYTAPISSGATAYNQAAQLEALFAAAWVYQTRMVQNPTGTAEGKGNVFMTTFDSMLKAFLRQDLSGAGLTHTSTAYAGGISIDDKADVEDDSDRVAPRFRRGQHDVPGVDWNTSTSAS